MGKKYDGALERIRGIKEALPEAAGSAAEKAPESMRDSVGKALEESAEVAELVIGTLVRAIDGNLSDETDADVALAILYGAGAIESLHSISKMLGMLS